MVEKQEFVNQIDRLKERMKTLERESEHMTEEKLELYTKLQDSDKRSKTLGEALEVTKKEMILNQQQMERKHAFDVSQSRLYLTWRMYV